MPSEKNIGFMAGSSRPLWVAFALLLVSCVLFMTLNVKGDWDFVLHLRLTKLAALLMVAYAVRRVHTTLPNADQQPDSDPFDFGFRFTVCVFADLAGVYARRRRLFFPAVDGQIRL